MWPTAGRSRRNGDAGRSGALRPRARAVGPPCRGGLVTRPFPGRVCASVRCGEPKRWRRRGGRMPQPAGENEPVGKRARTRPPRSPGWLDQVPTCWCRHDGAGIVVVAAAHFKRGPAIIATSLLLGAVLRAPCPPSGWACWRSAAGGRTWPRSSRSRCSSSCGPGGPAAVTFPRLISDIEIPQSHNRPECPRPARRPGRPGAGRRALRGDQRAAGRNATRCRTRGRPHYTKDSYEPWPRSRLRIP